MRYATENLFSDTLTAIVERAELLVAQRQGWVPCSSDHAALLPATPGGPRSNCETCGASL